MLISIIVPIFNGTRYLPAFFQSLDAALPEGAQLIFVDDGSTEPVLDAMPEFTKAREVVVLRNEQNLGYSAAVNRGFATSVGDMVVQLNTDLILDPSCISSMIETIVTRRNAGIIGSKLLFPTNQLVQHIGMAFGNYTRKHIYFQLPADHPLCCRTRPMQILTGATVAMTRQLLDRLGPLDERYFNYNEDIDHCLKSANLGFQNYTCAESVAYHWVSQSGPARFARIRESEAVFWSTWQARYRIDLDAFVDEALRHILEREPFLADLEFEVINLCRSGDDAILLQQVAQYWPQAVTSVRNARQVNNPDSNFWLPMVLPHWLQYNARPFIYFTDQFRQLGENRLWFQNRLNSVREELIIDTTGCVITASELLSLGIRS